MNKTGLVSLLQSPHIWRVGDMPRLERTGWPTGFDALDAELPEGGWPKRGLTELLCDHQGIGEVSVLLPALSAISKQPQCMAWINPPYLPYAPGLINAGIDIGQMLVVQPAKHADTLWAAEQTLRSGAMGAALIWLTESTDYAHLRRLHLAAESGHCAAFVFRPTGNSAQASPAPLRIRLDTDTAAPLDEACRFSAVLLKRRGLMAHRRVPIAASGGRSSFNSNKAATHLLSQKTHAVSRLHLTVQSRTA